MLALESRGTCISNGGLWRSIFDQLKINQKFQNTAFLKKKREYVFKTSVICTSLEFVCQNTSQREGRLKYHWRKSSGQHGIGDLQKRLSDPHELRVELFRLPGPSTSKICCGQPKRRTSIHVSRQRHDGLIPSDGLTTFRARRCMSPAGLLPCHCPCHMCVSIIFLVR